MQEHYESEQIIKLRETFEEILANNPGKQEFFYAKKAINVASSYETLSKKLSTSTIHYIVTNYDISKVKVRKEINLNPKASNQKTLNA